MSERARSLTRVELVLPALVVFLLALPVFARLCGAPDPAAADTDHPRHVTAALAIPSGGEIPPHPLFHFCLLVLSFGNNPAAAPGMAAVLLALALGARAYLSALWLTSRGAPGLREVTLTCLALALVMPLPPWWKFPSVYLGQVSPNVWHNPTTVVAMPFALGLSLLGLRALEDPRLSVMGGVGGLMVLSILAKPNFVLAFAPCFALAALVALARAARGGRLSVFGALVRVAVAFGPPAGVLGYQFVTAFGGDSTAASRVAFEPFTAWALHSPNIPASILLGVAFPVVVAALFPRQAVRDPGVLLAWAVLAVAVAQFALVAETGERSPYGNFGWGPVLASHVLFVACCALVLRQPDGTLRDIALLVLGLHVASGCVCLARCLWSPELASTF